MQLTIGEKFEMMSVISQMDEICKAHVGPYTLQFWEDIKTQIKTKCNLTDWELFQQDQQEFSKSINRDSPCDDTRN